jgi:NADPH2:quinone reductase
MFGRGVREMTRAVVADELGPIETYELRSVQPRALGPKDVRIAVKTAGVSFVDVLVATGRYQTKPKVPFTPGSECAGVVTEVGSEVEQNLLGQKVMATGWRGMFADSLVLPATALWTMPESLSFPEAAVLAVSYATVWHGLIDRAHLQPGETLLVLGAGGATGFAAVQIGAHLGAHVIASASSEAKRAMAIAGGAHGVVDSRSADWRAAVKAANAGKPVDVVFDPVGGEATEPAFRALGWNGRHLVAGFPAGIASVRTNLPLLKGASLIGVNLAQFSAADPRKAQDNQTRVLALAAQGHFKPVIARTYPLDHFAEAMAAASNGGSAGRIVITMETNRD